MKNIITNSLLAAAVYIVVYLVLYFIDPSLNFNFIFSVLISLVIYPFFQVRAGFQKRKNLGGFISFGEVFVPSIAIYAIASFIALIFYFIMINLDPQLVELVKESSNRISESMFSMVGMSEEQIALAIEETNERMGPDQLTSISNFFVSWLTGIIFPGLLCALIASLIVKKKDKSIA